MDGRGTWIALKFEKGGTLGSAGLSINLLTNILYRQAAALHPNLPLPAIAHFRALVARYALLQPAPCCACTTRPLLPTNQPTNHRSGRQTQEVTQRQKHLLGTHSLQIGCNCFTYQRHHLPIPGYFLPFVTYLKATRPGVGGLVQTPPYNYFDTSPAKIHGTTRTTRAIFGRPLSPLHRVRFVCVCLAQGTGDLGWLA